MNTCPLCTKEIPLEANFCPYCGKPLRKVDKLPWYFKTSVIVFSLLSVGPFALPLVWFHPKLSLNKKIILTVVLCILSYLVWIWVLKLGRQLYDSYQEVFKMLEGV